MAMDVRRELHITLTGLALTHTQHIQLQNTSSQAEWGNVVSEVT